MENGVKVIYIRLLKALYGCMESALLWYYVYSKTLESQGFVVNPYGRCISNSTIGGIQFMIAWYIDNKYVLHDDEHFNKKKIKTIP